MRSFKELQEKHRQTVVRLDHKGITGTGVIALAGRETIVDLSGESLLALKAGRQGWFDLSLKSSEGAAIFLHNALLMSMRMPSPATRDYGCQVFPNFVAFDADGLGKDGKLREITFTMERLSDFFHYEVIEWQSLQNAPRDVQNALRKTRKDDGEYQRNHDFFHPSEVYIVHRPPRPFQFRIDERRYEVNIRTVGRSLVWNMAGVRALPFATIKFDTPVTIEVALSHAWDWRRFFVEIAAEPLPFIGISVLGRSARQFRPASLYLPNLDETRRSGTKHRDFYPALVPFSGWKKRKEFAELMAAWLHRQKTRRIFRSNLDDVINEMHERVSLDQILKLAAGADSLKELDKASEYSSGLVAAMAKAAIETAKEHGVDVNASRVRGVLDTLLKQNFGRRLSFLFDAIAPASVGRDFSLLIDTIKKFRNAAAHGESGIEMSAPRLPAAVRGFAAACSLWDNMTSGLPAEETRTFNPRFLLSDALSELASFDRHSAAK